jgi:hypothetical protein
MPIETPAQTAGNINRLADHTLGRYQGPEPFFSTTNTFAAPTAIRPNRPIPLARALESVQILIRGRLVIGTANYTAGVPEAPQTLLERIIIRGNHRQYGSQVPINISGATAFAWARLFQQKGNDLLFGTTRSADPGMPFVGTTGLTTGATGTYDFHIAYEVPVAPMLGMSPSGKRAMIPFLWREEDWGNTLLLQLDMGDRTSLGTPAGGTTTTWTAFGSATGVPTVEVFLNYSLMGAFARTGRNGLVVRSEDVVTPSLVAAATNAPLGTELRKQITTNIIVKSGIVLTGTSAGVNVFASLSDVQLDRTRVLADTKPIRDTGRNLSAKSYYGRMFNTIQPQGYLLLSFIEGGNPLLALRAEKIPGGSQFALYTDVLTADANNRQHVIQEQVYGGPYL